METRNEEENKEWVSAHLRKHKIIKTLYHTLLFNVFISSDKMEFSKASGATPCEGGNVAPPAPFCRSKLNSEYPINHGQGEPAREKQEENG